MVEYTLRPRKMAATLGKPTTVRLRILAMQGRIWGRPLPRWGIKSGLERCKEYCRRS